MLYTSTTILGSSPNPSVVGQTVTITTAVNMAPTAPAPTGTEIVYDGSTQISPILVVGPSGSTFAVSNLSPGRHSLTAVYSGDGIYAPSTSAVFTQTVRQNTTTALSAAPNPAMPGNSVAFTATVTASVSGTPTGSVTFNDGSTPLGTAPLNASGVAAFNINSLAVGSHSITAVYGGDTIDLTSASSALNEVVQGSISISLVSSANPSVAGSAVTFTATVAGASSTPTGTVTFKDGAVTLGSSALNGSGVATFSTSSLAPAQHSITAVYSGDNLNLPGTSGALTQSVQQSTTTVLSSNANPVYSGATINFTAKVTAAVSGTPTGSVTFKDGSTALGTVTLNASGVAALSTSTLAVVGAHSITAVYSGDAIDLASTSGSLSETVNAPDFSIVANPSTATVLSGQSASYTLTITPDGVFANPISFSCSGLPELASCSFSPASVTPNTGVVTTTLTITTAGSSSGMLAPIRPDGPSNQYVWPASLWLLALAIALFLVIERHSAVQLRRRFLLATAALAIVGAIGCSSSHAPATPPGTSQVMVQGTGQNGTGSATHSVSVTLTVQQ